MTLPAAKGSGRRWRPGWPWGSSRQPPPTPRRPPRTQAPPAPPRRLPASGVNTGHVITILSDTEPRAARCTPVRGPKETQMRAMVLPRFGGPDLFEPREVERPSPGAGEVLVRVVATAVNPVDAKLRADGTWAGLRAPVILGYDAAGVVEEAGPGVSAFRPGDEVYYTPEIFGNQNGSYAEFNAAPASIVARKPAGLSFEEACAIPLAGGTAWEAVVRRLAVRPGETVLIQGAAGGVGTFAVQFAKAAGARVLATASAPNHGTLRDLGADVVIDYRNQDAAAV